MENIFPKRKQIRLKGYDYSQSGYYFVTICTEGKGNILGAIQGGEMILNQVGKMVEKWWFELGNKYPTVKLQEFVVMPNHIHGIIEMRTQKIVGAPLVGDRYYCRAGTRPAPTLGHIIGAFKSITTHDYIVGVKDGFYPPYKKSFWQRNYYEHIIRSDEGLQEVCKYISDNPKNWKKDKLYHL